LEPYITFDVDNCGVEGLNDVFGVVERRKMIDDEVCVYEVERKKGWKDSLNSFKISMNYHKNGTIIFLVTIKFTKTITQFLPWIVLKLTKKL
jgi:hypothetical protein